MESVEKKRVFVVDDHIAMRVGISTTINNQKDLIVVGEASNGTEALDKLREINVDVVVLDLRMPETDGIETIKSLKRLVKCPYVLVYSSYANAEDVYKSFKAGANGFVVKDMGLPALLDGIRSVSVGKRYVPESISSLMVMRMTMDLSSREISVLEYVAEGFSNKEIADKMDVAPGTVKVHLANIYRKLNVNDRTQAVLYALKNHMIAVD